jgi:crotonobetainyl-CoA:carnitine CoA-transferase CaiB-like acyl-CoA transferase
MKKSDVLVETFRPGGLESWGFERSRLCRLNPRLIHLSITPFGRSGPRRDYCSCDSVAAAFGGQTYLTGNPLGPPLKLFGRQSYYAASLFGAVAVLIHLKKRKMTGRGGYIDLSIHEAVASTLGHVMIDFFHGGRIAKRGDGNDEGFAILPCKDGHIQIPIRRSWDTLLELMRSEGLAGDLLERKWQERAYREEHVDQMIATIGEWTQRHTKQKLFELGQAMRFPWAPVNSIEDVLNSPQLKSREFFAPTALPEGDPSGLIPGPPYRFSSFSPPPPKPPVAPGENDPRAVELLNERKGFKNHGTNKQCADEEILRGVRVLDLTRMLSGPYATRILADFGAEVIKVQSEKTAQGAERNDTASFAAWNRNKRSITLDLDRPDARDIFLRLAADSDIVVENFSPRVMANWGLEYKRLREIKPDLVMMSISATGQTGPWKDFVGLAPTFHALSGLISATSGNLNPPAGIGNPYADVIAGLYAALAILSAMEYRDKTGIGQHIDLSAYEAICTLTTGSKFEIRNSKLNGIYRCAGEDRWCVISVGNDTEWRTLCQAIGMPELTDELIGRWTAVRTPESVVEQLQHAGIAAGVVQNSADLAKDPQLAARRFFVPLKHPTLGKVISDRSPLWNWRKKPKHWKSSPLLGEHNTQYRILSG